MTSSSVIIDMNMLLQTWGLARGAENMRVLIRERRTTTWKQLGVSRIFSGAALHTPFNKFIFFSPAASFRLFLPSRPHLFKPFATLREQSRFAQTALVTSPCHTAFALLLNGKCHFVSLWVFWLSSLPGSEWDFCMNLFWVLSVFWTEFLLSGRTLATLLLMSLSVRGNAIFSNQAIKLWNPTHLLGRRPFGSKHQHPLHLVLRWLWCVVHRYSHLLHFPYKQNHLLIVLMHFFHCCSLPCSLIEMSERSHLRQPESWFARYKKKPPLSSSNLCLSPCSSKCLFLYASFSPQWPPFVMYSRVSGQRTAIKPVSMSYFVP